MPGRTRAGIGLAILFVCGREVVEAQAAAFVCSQGLPPAPLASIIDFGNVTVLVFDPASGKSDSTFPQSGFWCQNVQSVPVQFTGIDLGPSTTFSGFAIWGYCINGLCVDGSGLGAVPPRGLIVIPVAFLPTQPRRYTTTFQVLNGSGFAPTSLTVTGVGVPGPSVPTLSSGGLLALFAGVLVSGVALLSRR